MNTLYHTVLIDMSSIQGYIFSSNKLKVNIGASYAIESEVYGLLLEEAIKRIGKDVNLNKWAETPGSLLTDNVEIGYIGGGNALVLFKEKEDAQKFIRNYTRLLLAIYPGLQPILALKSVENFDGDNFSKEFRELHELLRKNKQAFFRQNNILKPGITNDCRLSGELEEFNDKYEDYLISGSAKSKYNAFDRAQVWYNNQYKEELADKYEFPADFSDLGVDEEKGYISLVHIDGNSIGKKFMECSDLKSFRELSSEVKKNSYKIMKEIVKHLVSLFENKSLELDKEIILKKSKNNKLYLPFRPIITGGDDFTFVCEGRLGLYLAEKLIELFSKESIGGMKLSACGGVAIAKTKYPFSRTYKLSELLISQAKELVKSDRTKEQNAIHFMIVGSGFNADSYEQIIEEKFKLRDNKILINGPYYISQPGKNNIQTLKQNIKKAKTEWPMSIIKELRGVLTKDDSAEMYTVQRLKARGLDVKNLTGFQNDALWEDKQGIKSTPLFDVFEMTSFYPNSLIK